MQYTVVHFDFSFAEDWQADVFAQSLFDIGFDTIDQSDAYIPSAMLDTDALRALVEQTEGAEIKCIEACPDDNWNAAWESAHTIETLPMGVRIIPRCAFGAGHHETTGMMIDALMARDLHGCNVLDNGCGTGVLGIIAAKRGASVVAVDIDDKSVANTRENAADNGVTIEVHLGCRPLPPDGKSDAQYDLIMANIHRNILLEQMPDYARMGRELWLSGFFEDDAPALIDAAQAVGFRLTDQQTRNGWCWLALKRRQQNS